MKLQWRTSTSIETFSSFCRSMWQRSIVSMTLRLWKPMPCCNVLKGLLCGKTLKAFLMIVLASVDWTLLVPWEPWHLWAPCHHRLLIWTCVWKQLIGPAGKFHFRSVFIVKGTSWCFFFTNDRLKTVWKNDQGIIFSQLVLTASFIKKWFSSPTERSLEPALDASNSSSTSKLQRSSSLWLGGWNSNEMEGMMVECVSDCKRYFV